MLLGTALGQATSLTPPPPTTASLRSAVMGSGSWVRTGSGRLATHPGRPLAVGCSLSAARPSGRGNGNASLRPALGGSGSWVGTRSRCLATDVGRALAVGCSLSPARTRGKRVLQISPTLEVLFTQASCGRCIVTESHPPSRKRPRQRGRFFVQGNTTRSSVGGNHPLRPRPTASATSPNVGLRPPGGGNSSLRPRLNRLSEIRACRYERPSPPSRRDGR